MHHGGLGYIDTGKLYLPDDLLKPLSITHESILFGLYYPPPSLEGDYVHVRLVHDLMLTPVPPRLWPKIGRLVIRLKHRPTMTHAISDFIAKKNVSILLTESSRSGHRYATWNLTVAFDYLKVEELHFDPQRSIYKETYRELLKLKKELLQNCTEYLFTDFSDFYMKEPVIALPDTTLSYFHQKVEERTKSLKSEGWYYQVFKLTCDDEGVIESTQGEVFEAILEHISTAENIKLPKCVFANMNTNDMNIRVIIIPPEEQHRFSLVTFDYKRSGIPDTSRGIIAHLTEYFPKHYNIWNLTTRTKISTMERERGSTTFLIENQSDATDLNQFDLEFEMEKICAKPLPTHLKQIKSLEVHVTPISAYIFQMTFEDQRIKKRKFKYDVFLSYSSLDNVEANMVRDKLEKERIRCFMASSELNTGDIFSEEIREALINSMEICLLFSPNSAKSNWVKRERGAAWVLKKRIVPILFQMKNEDLPDELKVRQACNLYQLDRYVQEVKRRRDALTRE